MSYDSHIHEDHFVEGIYSHDPIIDRGINSELPTSSNVRHELANRPEYSSFMNCVSSIKAQGKIAAGYGMMGLGATLVVITLPISLFSALAGSSMSNLSTCGGIWLFLAGAKVAGEGEDEKWALKIERLNQRDLVRSRRSTSEYSPASYFQTRTEGNLYVNIGEFETNPKKILKDLGKILLTSRNPIPKVFYNDNGKQNVANDAGGVRRDLISRLSDHLFSKKGDGFLTMEDEYPSMKEGEEDSYRTLGNVMAQCYQVGSDFKTGALFSEKTYELFTSVPTLDNFAKDKMKEWQLDQIIRFKGLTDPMSALVDTLTNLDARAPAIAEQQMEILSYVVDETGDTKLPPDYFSDPSNRVKLRQQLIQKAEEDGRLQAIAFMALGFQKVVGEQEWENIRNAENSAQAVMDRIQGVLDASAVKEKLVWSKVESVNNREFEKTQRYLNKWIDDADVEMLQKLVRAISGSNAVPAQKLKVDVYNRGEGFIPVAHTCFFSLDLSAEYSSQEVFNEKLELLLSEGMAGIGFQII